MGIDTHVPALGNAVWTVDLSAVLNGAEEDPSRRNYFFSGDGDALVLFNPIWGTVVRAVPLNDSWRVSAWVVLDDVFRSAETDTPVSRETPLDEELFILSSRTRMASAEPDWVTTVTRPEWYQEELFSPAEAPKIVLRLIYSVSLDPFSS